LKENLEMARKKAAKKHEVTHIVVLLDRSGSMESVREDTIGGFNAFLLEQKKLKGTAVLTLAQFDNKYELVHTRKAIETVPELTKNTFVPRGSTALLDGIGRTINETDQTPKADKVVFAIITDGGENSSVEFTRDKVFEMIKAHDKWEFVFLGANQDAIGTGGSLGIVQGKSMTYAANAAGTQSAFSSLSRATSNYRGGAVGQMAFDAEDRELQKKAGA
jgi:Mg-chelatase subunit ChlD